MLAAMRLRRLPALATGISTLLAVAWSIGAGGGCGHDYPETNYPCSVPTPGEIGKDGGPDPCHCQLNAVNPVNCPCDDQDFQVCMQIVASARDGGSDTDGDP
jgi:hypothetical protein